MISFKSFLYLSEETNIEFRQDNPGGNWLRAKQEDAEKSGRKVSGPITGYFTKDLKLPVKEIKDIPGSMGEESYRSDSSKMKDLEKTIEDPSNFDSKSNPILIGVNHRGEAHVLEGNHRLAYATKHNIPHIYAEVKYYSGGEDVNGPHHPDKILNMAQG
jgi:hypothetical protein